MKRPIKAKLGAKTKVRQARPQRRNSLVSKAISNLRKRNEALKRESRDAHEQQTATSEVLRVISNSTGDLEPVFQDMLSNATRICEATFGSMLLREGDTFRRVALHNAPRQF